MRPTQKFWILLLAATVITGCSDEDNQCRLIRYFHQHISYDQEGRVYASRELGLDNEIVVDGLNKVMEYDADNRIVKISEYEGRNLFQYFEIEYEPGKIIQRKYKYSSATGTTINSNIATYTLNSQGKILTIDRINRTTNVVSYGLDTYEYDNRGNVTKVVFVSETYPEDSNTQEFGYDNKNNPLLLTGFQIALGQDDVFSYLTQNRNNIIKRRTVYPDIELPFAESKYQYNDQGYPTHIFSGTSPIESFEYDCI